IQIKDVTKVFGDYNDQVKSLLKENKSIDEILKETGSTVAVKNANFTIEVGEVFVVMGLSGSGKSTLIRLINRLIDPTDGDILINSNNISSLNKEDLRNFRRDNLSMVFQSCALFPFKTVVENVAFGLEVKDVP
ncbi:ATP-binding cassette domain-containing protein, partial [Bacillus subtilis]|uniref:ATP-binding cassette domain-containing protein n=1 Tax=Bacillus subtilis TaxID=1423 RepID=UPI00397F257F